MQFTEVGEPTFKRRFFSYASPQHHLQYTMQRHNMHQPCADILSSSENVNAIFGLWNQHTLVFIKELLYYQ